MRFELVLLFGASLVAAAPQPAGLLSLLPTAPTVKIQNGTVVGSTSNGVDSFKGIPFALPPTGTRRLKPPATITSSFGTITATGTPTSCPQMAAQAPNPLATIIPGLNGSITGPQGEDCLTLNVQRPSTASSAKPLPVLFWIYGGGFEFGSTSMYDGSGLVSKSMALGGDFIFVAVNYRVAAYGFLASKELQQDGSTNLGLRDQRLGLQWVAENIAAFGGDPNRVTIWGESAGAISVFDHLIINNGDNTYKGKPLFIGAMADSGTAVPTSPVNAAKPQAIYDQVVAAAGCSSASNTLACLRSVPYATFQNASNSVPGIFSYRSLDLSYLPRYDPNDSFFPASPEIALKAGKFARVPYLVGDQEDEGTLFTTQLNNVTDTDKLVTYLQTYFPDATRADVQGLVDTYPADPAAGSPFNSGLLNEIYPGFKRNSALLGDITFTITRRITLSYLKQAAPTMKMWSYLGSYFSGTPVLGTFHATDILELYFGIPYANVQSTIATYYTSFVNYQNPNMYNIQSGNINWPEWTSPNSSLVHFHQLNTDYLTDNFRNASYDYLRPRVSIFHV